MVAAMTRENNVNRAFEVERDEFTEEIEVMISNWEKDE